MTTTQKTKIKDDSLSRDVLYALRYYTGGRRGFRIFAATALVLSLVFNWGWLVAVGIAPLLLTALPCVAMCALGLCMNRLTGRSTCASTETDKLATDGDETALLTETSGNNLPKGTIGNLEPARVEATPEQSQAKRKKAKTGG